MEAARIKKEVDEREREREREIPPLAILPGDAVMYSHSHPPQPTGTTMNVASKRLSISNWPGHGREDVRGVEGKNRKNF